MEKKKPEVKENQIRHMKNLCHLHNAWYHGRFWRFGQPTNINKKVIKPK